MKKLSFGLILVLLLSTACNKKIVVSSENIETQEQKETVVETTKINKNVKKIPVAYQDMKTGYDIVMYGTYNFTKDDKFDIEWLVVDKDETSYFLVSKFILDCKNYNEQKIDVIFDKSSINEWLHTTFFDKAFTGEEIDNIDYGSDFLSPGEGISLLNLDECKKYFNAKEDADTNYLLAAEGTDYAILNKLEVEEKETSPFYNCGSYYLVNNGNNLKKAMWVGRDGKIHTSGQSVTLNYGDGVRPVIALKKEMFDDLEIKELNTTVNIENETSNEISSETETATESENENKGMSSALDETETTITTESIDKSDDNDINIVGSIEESVATESIVPEFSLSTVYDNTTSEKYKSEAVPLRERNVVEINDWEYGRTPLEWIYVKPNTQIICNNTPNNSINFSYKKQASSGSKGCFMPVFTNSKSFSDDYDGRFYSIYDYTKYQPREMYWSDTATFESLIYKGYQVKELLQKKYDVVRITRNLIMIGDTYVNIVYVSELDEIIEKYCK